jgi:hypothetical protein
VFRIKFFGLFGWIENAEIRRCICAATGGPLPAPGIAGKVKIK